ncbi:MAG TPA: hypothetical protein VFA58_06735 [Chthoniobacterales bacterium]|nr:hypothetical protein [Chthoniobacterales bacterium]
MEKIIKYTVESDGSVTGADLHDGYLYGVIQENEGLVIHAEAADDSKRRIKLLGLTEMNVTDFWMGTIVCDVWLWPRDEAPNRIWEELFKGRIAMNDPEGSLKSLIENTRGRYFFALESSYGANVYAVCDDLQITQPSES